MEPDAGIHFGICNRFDLGLLYLLSQGYAIHPVLPVQTGKVQKLELRILIGTGGVGPEHIRTFGRADPGVGIVCVHQIQVAELAALTVYRISLAGCVSNQHVGIGSIVAICLFRQQLVEEQGDMPRGTLGISILRFAIQIDCGVFWKQHASFSILLYLSHPFCFFFLGVIFHRCGCQQILRRFGKTGDIADT